MERRLFAAGAALAGLAVAAGAFGAHALKALLAPAALATFETAARYQLSHGLALLAIAWAIGRWPSRGLVWAGWIMMAGVLLFSGSLYVLVFTGQRWLGMITPLGGVAMLAGWALTVVAVLRHRPGAGESPE